MEIPPLANGHPPSLLLPLRRGGWEGFRPSYKAGVLGEIDGSKRLEE